MIIYGQMAVTISHPTQAVHTQNIAPTAPASTNKTKITGNVLSTDHIAFHQWNGF